MTALKANEAARRIRSAAGNIPASVAPSGEERLVAYVDGETDTAYEVQLVTVAGGEVRLHLSARPKVLTVQELRNRLAGLLYQREVEVVIDGKRYAVTDAQLADDSISVTDPTLLTVVER